MKLFHVCHDFCRLRSHLLMFINTDVSKMHNNRIILFFIETGKLLCIFIYYAAVNDMYLFKVPITWISLYFLFTMILMYL